MIELVLAGEHSRSSIIHRLVARKLWKARQLVERGDSAHLEFGLTAICFIAEVALLFRSPRGYAICKTLSNLLIHCSMERLWCNDINNLTFYESLRHGISRQQV